MKKLLLLFSLLGAAQLSAPLRAQSNTAYDCIFSQVLTTSGAGTTFANSLAGGQSMCRSWAIEYYTDGFSTVSLQFETADRTSSNTVGSFTIIPNTICAAAVQPPCLIDGVSPITTISYGTFAVRAYAPFVRVNVTSVGGGPGHVSYRFYGYKGLSQ